jgi:16S rRNA (guanine966-N2)-methyltransferase
MTRIIAGEAGSLRLKAPDKVSRPTSDRVREAIFSRVESVSGLSGARVLDLFAGTGALGLEAASRGASAVWLVENHAGAHAVLNSNIALVSRALSHSPALRAIKASVASYLAGTPDGSLSLVFLDPPYDYPSGTLDDHLQALLPWLAPEALVVVERSSKSAPPHFPDGYEELSPKTYGDTTVYWARLRNGSQPPA